MVKRNYSRLAYAAPITLAVALLATQLPLALLTLNQPGSCNAAACNDVMWLQATEAVLQIAGALLLGAWGWYTRRESVRNDQRRQAAARGEGVRIPLNETLLGDERPPLTLPVTIRLKLVWRDWFIAAGASLLLIQCLVPPVLALTYHPDPGQWSTLAVVAVAEASLIIFVLLLTGLGALLGRETLVVTPDGLRARRFGLPQFVRWEEARLFARLDDIHFELASRTAIVRFTRLDQIRGQRPTIPFDDYRRQTDALLVLIAERTSLPLHDLRDEK